MPLAAVGLPPVGHPTAVAVLIVGIYRVQGRDSWPWLAVPATFLLFSLRNYGNLITGNSDPLATGGIILSYFGSGEERQREGYKRFVDEGIPLPDPVNIKVLQRMRSWGQLPKRPFAAAPVL